MTLPEGTKVFGPRGLTDNAAAAEQDPSAPRAERTSTHFAGTRRGDAEGDGNDVPDSEILLRREGNSAHFQVPHDYFQNGAFRRLGGTATAFDVYVDGMPLPGDDNGLKADYYAADVISANETTCRCHLVHVRRRLTRSQQTELRQEEAPYMLARFPQASTAIVSVRMRPALPRGEE